MTVTNIASRDRFVNRTLEVRDHADSGFAYIAVHDGKNLLNINVDRAELLKALGAVDAPAPSTNSEVRDSLPNGSVIRFNSEKGGWHKLNGKWYSSELKDLSLSGAYNGPRWVQHVVYNPEADQ